MTRARDIASLLLDLKAVVVRPDEPFTWASGLRAPIYCDNRLIISDVPGRKLVIDAFLELIGALPLNPDVVAGTATAGIPHAAWVAHRLGLPMVYVRGKAKSHGKGYQIEGRLQASSSVVLIEDLISTGGSSIRAARALIEAGAKRVVVTAIFQYGMQRARAAFDAAAIDYRSLCDLDTLLELLGDRNLLSSAQLESMREWQGDPDAWSRRSG